MIVERVRSGMARARERGTKSGKAIGRPRIPAPVRAATRLSSAVTARRRSTAVTFGAVADHAIGTEPGKVDADRDQAFACVQRARCFAVEQRIAAAEAAITRAKTSSRPVALLGLELLDLALGEILPALPD